MDKKIKSLNKVISFCKDCKYFILPPFNIPIKFGKCERSGELNLVDGNIEYKYAEIFRHRECQGVLFERKNIN